MKKGKASKLAVKRISTSPYFNEHFALLEKQIIESLGFTEVLTFNSAEVADVLITNTHTQLEQLSAIDIERCKLMIHPNSGYDNFSADFIKQTPFPVIIGNPIRAQAVTEFILSALFSHYTSIPSQITWDKNRLWPRKRLSELSLLILGKGHIGALLEATLKPLVHSISFFDPYCESTQHIPLPDLKNIDVLIPACSLNQNNHGLINYDWLTQLKKDFLLINAARGALVKTQDLITVLQQQKKAHAYLDVFELEPADFSLFKGLENIKLSSHIAGVYANIDQATSEYEASVIFDFQNITSEEFENKYQTTLLKNRLRGHFLI
ncbi:MAG: hypothetical protein KBD76_05385 [Bacteriovorax sp.]|nr:hypothetical protein [Bacteriovorax sp.]